MMASPKLMNWMRNVFISTRKERLKKFISLVNCPDKVKDVEDEIENPAFFVTRSLMLEFLLDTTGNKKEKRLPKKEIIRLAHLLLDKGAHPFNSEPCEALMWNVVSLQDEPLIIKYISRISNIDGQYPGNGHTVLADVCYGLNHLSNSKNRLSIVKTLLSLGASPNNVRVGSINDCNLIKLLIDSGLDKSYTENWPENHDALRLMVGQDTSSMEVIELLVKSGFRTHNDNYDTSHVSHNPDDYVYRDVIAIALRSGRWDNAQKLIDLIGFNPEQPGSVLGESYWHPVAYYLADQIDFNNENPVGVNDIPADLLEKLLKVPMDVKDNHGNTIHSILKNNDSFSQAQENVEKRIAVLNQLVAMAEEKTLLSSTALSSGKNKRVNRL